jgi:CheY-like chemotaxis protein
MRVTRGVRRDVGVGLSIMTMNNTPASSPSSLERPRARPLPKTLLAVDDSITMRRVLEMSFGSDEYRVVTAGSAEAALGKMIEKPKVVVIDATLGNDDGYALSREIRRRDPSAAIILLSSRYHPYDPARGRAVGADDFIDKPLDTQQLQDKVALALAARHARFAEPAPSAKVVGASGAIAPAATHPPVVPAPIVAAPLIAVRRVPPVPTVPVPAPRADVAPATGFAAGVDGQLATRLRSLGLTARHVEAVVSLSREVVERVVWDVVPELAEVLIKAEIARLMKS